MVIIDAISWLHGIRIDVRKPSDTATGNCFEVSALRIEKLVIVL